MKHKLSIFIKIGLVLVAIFLIIFFSAIAYRVFILNEDEITYHIGVISFGSSTGLGMMLSFGVLIIGLIIVLIRRFMEPK